MPTLVNNLRAIRGPVTAVPVTAGSGIEISADTENNQIVISSNLEAGSGIEIVDDNGKAKIINSDNAQALPIVAGTGVKLSVVNNQVVVSADETVLWEGFKTDIPNTGLTSYTLSELATNFERVKVIYVLQSNVVSQSDLGNKGIGTFEMVMGKSYSRSITYVHCVMNGANSTDGFSLYDIDTNIYNMDTLTWGVKSKLRGQDTNGIWFHITKIVGIHRLSN